MLIRCTGLCGAWAGIPRDVFGIGGAAQAVGNVAAAGIQASATRDAAKMAVDSANRSADMVQKRYDTTRGDLQPYQGMGLEAMGWQHQSTGAYSDIGADFTKELEGANPTYNTTDIRTPNAYGALTLPDGYNNSVMPEMVRTAVLPGQMTQAQLEATPGYQFNLSQGLQAVQNSASARGLGVSGAALKGAASYATGLADSTYQQQFNNQQTRFQDAYNQDSQQFGQQQSRFQDAFNKDDQQYSQANSRFQDALSQNNQMFGQQQSVFGDTLGLRQAQFGQAQQRYANILSNAGFDQQARTAAANRLYSIAALGENAAAQTGVAGASAANAAGNFLTSGASAAGAASIAGGNAWAGAVNGIGNAYQNYNQNQMVRDYLTNRNGGSSSGSGSAWDGAGTSSADTGGAWG